MLAQESAQQPQDRPYDAQQPANPANQRPHPVGQQPNGAQAYAAQLLRTYGPAAYAAGAALLHPMAHRPPAPHTHIPAPAPYAATDSPAAAAATATGLETGGANVLRKRNPSSSNLSSQASSRSSPSGSSTNLPGLGVPTTGSIAGKRTQTPTQVQVDEFIAREKARRAEAAESVATPSRWSFFGGSGRSPAKETPPTSSVNEGRQRVASASHLNVATGTERSLYGGFENIDKEEVDDGRPGEPAAARGRWFGWGGRPIEEAAAAAAAKNK